MASTRNGWDELGFRHGPAALLALASIVCLVLGWFEFRTLRAKQVDLPLSQTEYRAEGELVIGRVTQGMPKFHLWWDGEPPQATLVVANTGEVIGPSLMLETSLSLNARGTLWLKDGDCRYVLDRRTFDAYGPDGLALRAEKIPSRIQFYIYALLSVGAAFGAVIAMLIVRLSSAPTFQRSYIFWDNLRILTFVLLSAFSVMVFYPGHPVAHMSGDPANIHSFAAGLSAPADFQQDAVLSDQRNFAWYTPLYVKTVQLFGWLGFHYATSRAFLALISALLGLFGYYRLFKLISRSCLFGFLASLAIFFLKAHYPPNEDWGPILVLPRTVYSAMLPWVAWLGLKLLLRPSLWWVAAAASGLLFYVHPVSSPALTGALLTGYAWGGKSPWWMRLFWSGLGAVAALAVMYPYVKTYTQKYEGTVVSNPETVAQAFEISRERFAPGYLEPLVFYRDLFVFLVTSPRYWFGIAGLVALLWYRRRSLASRVAVGMTVGFVIVTCLIPTTDVLVAQRLGRLPFQIDLIRNLRYLDVWLLGIIGACVREFGRPGTLRDWTIDLQLASTRYLGKRQLKLQGTWVLAIVWLLACYTPSVFRSSYRMAEFSYDNLTILVGKPKGELAEDIEAFRAIHELRHAREVVGGTFHLRQIHIPVAYNDKDLGILAYSSPEQLIQAKNTLTSAAEARKWPMSEVGAVKQGSILNAQILLLDRPLITTALARSPRTLFQNSRHAIVRVTNQEILSYRSQTGQVWASAPQQQYPPIIRQ